MDEPRSPYFRTARIPARQQKKPPKAASGFGVENAEILSLVGQRGLEPPRYCYRQPLKLVRLPVPPRRHKARTLFNSIRGPELPQARAMRFQRRPDQGFFCGAGLGVAGVEFAGC